MDANSALQQATGQSGGINAALQQGQQETASLESTLQKTAGQQIAPPQLEKAPAAPEANMGQDATMWMGVMNVLAGIGGLKSRQGATTALTAFSSGVNAFKQGRLDEFQMAQQQWKEANQSVIENNKAQVDQYKAALQDKKMSIDEQMANIKIIASQNHNDIMAQLAEERNYTAMARVMDMMQSNNDKLQLAYDKMQQHVDEITGHVENTKAEAEDYKAQFIDPESGGIKPGSPDFKTFMAQNKDQYGMTKNKVGASNDTIAQKGEALYNGASYSDLGLSTRSGSNPERQAVDEWLTKNHPDFDRAAAVAGQAGRKAGAAAGGRREMQTSQALGELDQLIPAARQSLAKLKNSSYPDYNSLVNSAEFRAGDPDIIEAANMAQEVSNAYTAVLVRGGQRSDTAQAMADKLLQTNFSDPQWDRALDTMEKNSGRIMTGIQKGTKSFLSGGKSGDASGGGATHKWNPATGTLEGIQ